MNAMTWLQTAQQLQEAQQPFALVTVLRVMPPTSARAGDKAVVTADGKIHGWIGGGCAQPAVIKTVRAALSDGTPRTIRISPAQESQEQQLGDILEFGMSCHSGGTLELFIDPVLPQTALVVMGDSPVAQALIDLGPRVGFAVHAIAAAFEDIAVPAHSLVIVATQGRGDLPALRSALQAQARTIWFVASERKGNVLKESLKTSGFESAVVDAIIAPAGTPIGAQTPEEIALSVLGAVIAQRRQGLAAPTDKPKSSCCSKKAAAISAVTAPEAAMSSAAPPAAATSEAAPKRSCCGGS